MQRRRSHVMNCNVQPMSINRATRPQLNHLSFFVLIVHATNCHFHRIPLHCCFVHGCSKSAVCAKRTRQGRTDRPCTHWSSTHPCRSADDLNIDISPPAPATFNKLIVTDIGHLHDKTFPFSFTCMQSCCVCLCCLLLLGC